MLIAQAIYEYSANKYRRPSPRFLVDNQVWLKAKNLTTARPCVKLDNYQVGPFRIKRVFEKNPLIVMTATWGYQIKGVFGLVGMSVSSRCNG